MKISIIQNELLRAIKLIKGAVPVRTVMPILETIRIKADDTICLTATDLFVEISANAVGMVFETGEACVNANLLFNLVSKLPDEDVTISIENTNLVLVCDDKSYTIPIVFEGEFHCIEGSVEFPENIATLDGDVLKDNFSQVLYAAGKDDSNPVLSSICLDMTGRMIAIDGKRIAIKEFSATGDGKILIPAVNIAKLSKILSGEVKISANDKFVRFVSDDFSFISRLVEGTYFDVDKMTGLNETTSVKVGREALLENLNTLAVFVKANDKRPVILNISDKLNMSVNTSLGSGNGTLEIEKDGADLKIAFDVNLLIEALHVIPDSMIEIAFADAKMPAIIRGNDYLHLILPIAIKE